jgi:uncharacterized SAM-dependent methyltransferase
VELPVTSRTEGNEVFLHVTTKQTVRLHMMDMEFARTATILAAPSISLQYFLVQRSVNRLLKSNPRVFLKCHNNVSIRLASLTLLFQICPCEKIGANHLQRISPRFVTSQHQRCCFKGLLNDRQLAPVHLEINQLPGL